LAALQNTAAWLISRKTSKLKNLVLPSEDQPRGRTSCVHRPHIHAVT